MVPDFQTLMLPILTYLGDGQTHTNTEIRSFAAQHFKLSVEDLQELLPSGRQTKIFNRVSWALRYMKKAGLISSPVKSSNNITDAGKQLLAERPEKITRSILRRYPAFIEYLEGTNDPGTLPPALKPGTTDETEKSPDEIIAENYNALNNLLRNDLLEKVKAKSPAFFESLVLELLHAMGYGVEPGTKTGRSGDGGIDGIINEDKLGLDKIYVQAKRYLESVPIHHIRDFAGALLSKKARKGIFITSSYFPASAKEYVESIDRTIVLIDGNRLAELMIEHNVGVSSDTAYILKKIDNDFFDEE